MAALGRFAETRTLVVGAALIAALAPVAPPRLAGSPGIGAEAPPGVSGRPDPSADDVGGHSAPKRDSHSCDVLLGIMRSRGRCRHHEQDHGRGGGIRTHDLVLPKHVRYRCATPRRIRARDRKSTRLNSSHANISYAAFC